MHVLITGAAGRLGTILRTRLPGKGDYNITGIDIVSNDDSIQIGDMTDYDLLRDYLDGVDAVIHLGYIRDESLNHENRNLGWCSPLAENLQATANVFEASVEAGVDSVIYASSNHAVGLYEVENAPEIYDPDSEITVDQETRIRPDSRYGLSKVFGEGLGRLMAEVHDVRCYALRIAAVREDPYDHPYGDAERGVDTGRWTRDSTDYEFQVDRMKAMWMSQRDFTHLVHRCLQDTSVGFDIFYGVSDNERSWFDMEHAQDILGYRPMDSAENWTQPP